MADLRQEINAIADQLDKPSLAGFISRGPLAKKLRALAAVAPPAAVPDLNEILRVAADLADVASDWNLEDVQVYPPTQWALPANAESAADGWVSCRALASHFRSLSAAPTPAVAAVPKGFRLEDIGNGEGTTVTSPDGDWEYAPHIGAIGEFLHALSAAPQPQADGCGACGDGCDGSPCRLAQESPQAEATQQPEAADGSLWMMHVQGPDDIWAAPSRERAEAAAAKLNSFMAEKIPKDDENFPRVSAVVQPWEGTPEQHAQEVAKWAAEWEVQPEAARAVMTSAFRAASPAIDAAIAEAVTGPGGIGVISVSPEGVEHIPAADVFSAQAVSADPAIPEGFTPWGGGECPLEARGRKTEVIMRDGSRETLDGESFRWTHYTPAQDWHDFDIIAYRVEPATCKPALQVEGGADVPADVACWQHRPGALCPWPESCKSNGCSAVERELFPDDGKPAPADPPVDVEALAEDVGLFFSQCVLKHGGADRDRGPIYVFTPKELRTFARRLRPQVSDAMKQRARLAYVDYLKGLGHVSVEPHANALNAALAAALNEGDGNAR